jgi:tetratricopeptide (TPR) repeat protein
MTHFRAGQEAMQAGDFERASKEFRAVLRLSPALVEARANLGLAAYMLGEYDSAVTELTKVLRERPDLVGSNLFLGLSYLKLELPAKAIPPLKRALQADRSNHEARRALVSCHLAQRNYREAAREFRALFDLEPDKTEGWYNLGKDYLQISTQLAVRMATEFHNSHWTHRLAGDVLALRELWNDAAGEYRQALEGSPEQAGLRASLGMAYMHQGKLPDAEAAFQGELQRDPANEQAQLGLAELSLERSDTTTAFRQVEELFNGSPDFLSRIRDLPSLRLSGEQADELIKRVSEAAPGRPKHFLLAVLYKATGQQEKAEEHLALSERFSQSDTAGLTKEAELGAAEESCRVHWYAACAKWLQSKPRLGVGDFLELGKARLGMNQVEEATEAFGAALAADPENIGSVYWLVKTYQMLADDAFRRVEELSPESWRVHEMRGEAHKLRQAYNEAIEELRLAVRLRPNEPELYEAIGHAYLLKNSLEEARVELEKALELDPSRARSLFLLGRLYANRREEEKAIPYLQKALRRDPGLLEARASLGTAYRRQGQAALAVPELEKAASQDFYGDLHYQLYLAYRQLGKEELAQTALAQSQELRRSSAARHQARVAGVSEIEGD